MSDFDPTTTSVSPDVSPDAAAAAFASQISEEIAQMRRQDDQRAAVDPPEEVAARLTDPATLELSVRGVGRYLSAYFAFRTKADRETSNVLVDAYQTKKRLPKI